MSLTPEQIELLPPAQKEQVLALQQQLVSYPSIYYILISVIVLLLFFKYFQANVVIYKPTHAFLFFFLFAAWPRALM